MPCDLSCRALAPAASVADGCTAAAIGETGTLYSLFALPGSTVDCCIASTLCCGNSSPLGTANHSIIAAHSSRGRTPVGEAVSARQGKYTILFFEGLP